MKQGLIAQRLVVMKLSNEKLPSVSVMMLSSEKLPYEVYKDSDALAVGAAEHFVATVNSAIELRGVAYVALSGGSTPKKLFSILALDEWQLKVVWDKVHFFWVDERMVPYTSPESNYGVARELLFRRIDVPQSNIHPIPFWSQESEAAGSIAKVLEDYSCALKSLPGDVPEFDLVFLGMGADGHTASIFPGCEGQSISGSESLSALGTGGPNPDFHGEWVFVVTAGSPCVTRVSLKEEVITKARKIIFVVGGLQKAEMVKSALQWPQETEVLDLPAGRVTSKAKGRTLWLVDEDASQKIEG